MINFVSSFFFKIVTKYIYIKKEVGVVYIYYMWHKLSVIHRRIVLRGFFAARSFTGDPGRCAETWGSEAHRPWSLQSTCR